MEIGVVLAQNTFAAKEVVYACRVLDVVAPVHAYAWAPVAS